MYINNGCTYILAVPDAVVIKLLQDHFHRLLDVHMEIYFDKLFSAASPDAPERRHNMITFIGKTQQWFVGKLSGDIGVQGTFTKIAFKTGNLFQLNDDPNKQFERAVYRGYDKKMSDNSLQPKSLQEDITMANWRKQKKIKNKKGIKRSLKSGALTFDRRIKMIIASLIKLEKGLQVENYPLQVCVE